MESRTTTRSERLAWSPEQALAADPATCALALVEQLEAAGLPLESLEIVLGFWARALDGLDPGPVPEARLDRLESDLQLETPTSPVLARWMESLVGSVAEAGDLDRVIRLLMQAHTTWTTAARVRAREEERRLFPIGGRLDGGRFTIHENIRGVPARGQYRALGRPAPPPGRFLVALGSPQKRTAGEIRRELALEVEGISPLVHLGPLAGHEDDYHALVEAEPMGRPTTELGLPMSIVDAVLIAIEVADVLHRAHRAGHVLRHLRPELVYVEPREGGLRLAGLAPRAEPFLAGASPCYGVPPLFDTLFAAPEVIALSRDVTPAADVFSLCAALGLWLTGEHPFVGDDAISQMQAIMRHSGRVWRGPTALGMVLSAGLDHDPAHRPPLEQLASDLAAAARRDV